MLNNITFMFTKTQLRDINMYKVGDVMMGGLKVEEDYLQRCWKECLVKSDYEARKASVDEFNRTHRYWKNICSYNYFHISQSNR